MKIIPTIHLDLRTADARRMFNVSLSDLSDEEIAMLEGLFVKADNGTQVTMGIGQTEDGHYAMQIIAGATEMADA